MIVLVGVPGAGKSTVGPALAQRLGRPFTDIDDVIVARAGKPISEIFTDDGEPAFRALEELAIADVLGDSDGVVALGGGALGSDATRARLAGHTVVWLQADLASAVARVGLNRNRPLLLGNVRGQLADLMARRVLHVGPMFAPYMGSGKRHFAPSLNTCVRGCAPRRPMLLRRARRDGSRWGIV